MRRLSAIPLIALLAMAGAAPASADAFKPGKGDQIKLGKRAADELRRKERVLPSSDERVRLLRRVASRILSVVDDRNQPWEYSFDVIDSKQVNAFALPGGPMFFYTGLLDKMQTEDELAGVVAHELVHIRKEHWANAYAESQKRNLGLSLLLILSRANRTVADVASISNDLLFNLPYSRRMEQEADDQGYEAMVKAGYNPTGMANVFRMLERQSKGGKPPEFLSDHPSDRARISRIEKKIDASGRSFPAQRPLPWAR
jgi:beta-barrel assembly-enhancing protease